MDILSSSTDSPTGSSITRITTEFHELVSQVPDLLQPLIVAAAGAVPFLEGEVAAIVGVVGGLHPVVAGLAAATGNFLCVVLVVLLGGRARDAVARRSGRDATEKPRSKGRARFHRWFTRFGVPGASILGPLAIPTQFTAATLAAAGVTTNRVLVWQAVAIALWTTLATVSITAALALTA
ncbi:small multidrug efflux protein [Sanguibacter sp. 25GB23B1]|uniref:small multidrug efflux protein n=1 Tax=unclassified Sanguibacter TaxID=2645534 RepID=UPI0032AFF117